MLKVRGDGVCSRPPVRAELGFFAVPVVPDLAERISSPRKRRLFALVGRVRARQHPVHGFQGAEEVLLDIGTAADWGGSVAVGRCHRRVLTRLPSLNDLLHIGHAVAHVAGVPQGETRLGREVIGRHGVVAHRADHGNITPKGHGAIERLREEKVPGADIATGADLHGVPLQGAEQSTATAQGACAVNLDGIHRAELVREVEEIAHADRAVLAAVQTKDLAIVGAHQRLVFVGGDDRATGEGDRQVGGRDRVPRRDDHARLGRGREGVQSLGQTVPSGGLVDGNGVGRFDQVSHDRFLAPVGRLK